MVHTVRQHTREGKHPMATPKSGGSPATAPSASKACEQEPVAAVGTVGRQSMSVLASHTRMQSWIL